MLVRLDCDSIKGLGQCLERLQALGFGRLEHQGLIDDQGEVDRR